MNARLPLEINRRAIRLKDVTEDGLKLWHKYGNKRTYAEVWDLIISKRFDPEWYSIENTHDMREKVLTKIYDALEYRKYMHGLTTHQLTIRVVLVEGVCFRWQALDEGVDPLLLDCVRERKTANWEKIEARKKKYIERRKMKELGDIPVVPTRRHSE